MVGEVAACMEVIVPCFECESLISADESMRIYST